MTDALPPEFATAMADLTSHRIEGITIQGDVPFDCPLVTQVEGNLWQGGCPAPRVPAYFGYVLNLYPWVTYAFAPGTVIRPVKLLDSIHQALDVEQLTDLADWVNEAREKGPTLVHCQAGLNRSALVTGFALVRAGMEPDAAIALLREKRSPAVLCNPAFEAWLRDRVPGR